MSLELVVTVAVAAVPSPSVVLAAAASASSIKLRPKALIDVSSHLLDNSVSCHTKVLNSTTTISFPCIIAPTALHRLAHSEHGELATVRAAVACSTVMCVSSNASVRLERVAEEFQQQIKDSLIDIFEVTEISRLNQLYWSDVLESVNIEDDVFDVCNDENDKDLINEME